MLTARTILSSDSDELGEPTTIGPSLIREPRSCLLYPCKGKSPSTMHIPHAPTPHCILASILFLDKYAYAGIVVYKMPGCLLCKRINLIKRLHLPFLPFTIPISRLPLGYSGGSGDMPIAQDTLAMRGMGSRPDAGASMAAFRKVSSASTDSLSTSTSYSANEADR